MTQNKTRLQEFLEGQIDQINQDRIHYNQTHTGDPRQPLLTVRELARIIDVPEATLSRWANSGGGPRDYVRIQALAQILPQGEKLYGILGIDISKDLAWLSAHQHDPKVRQILEEAYKKAMEQQNGPQQLNLTIV